METEEFKSTKKLILISYESLLHDVDSALLEIGKGNKYPQFRAGLKNGRFKRGVSRTIFQASISVG